jgi:uncharacterized protein involved in outer membrane biogenesis
MNTDNATADKPIRRGPQHVLRSARAHPLVSALGVLLLAILVLVAIWDWNWLRGPVERIVQAQTGRSFDIGGDLDVDLGRVTRVRMEAVRFGNADWSTPADMAVGERVEFAFELLPAIFRREFRIPDLQLARPRLTLELGPDGTGNWMFGDQDDEGAPLQIRRLRIDDGRLQYLDAKGRTDINVALQSRAARQGGADDIVVEGKGRWKGNAFTLEGSAQSPLALQETEQPYRIDLRASAGATHAHARGTLLDPLRFRDFDLQLALSGRNMDDLYPLIGVAVPPTPPYSLDGRLTRDINDAASSTWKYDGFSGTVGDSDLAGFAHVTTGERTFLEADLRSNRLDFDDLAGFVGGAPDSDGPEKSNPELSAQAAKQAASPRLLPDTPYELDKLRAMDAEVRLRAARINAPGLPLDDMDAHLFLEGGVLRLEPLNFGVAGGDIRSTIRMDASESPIRTRADITMRGLELGKLVPQAELAKDAVGRINGDIDLAGNGNSVAKMLGSSSGDVAIGMGRGQISNLLMELAGLDIAEALKFLLTDDRKVPIRCAFGDFKVTDGRMQTRALAFDTTDTIIVGEGDINLRDETLDLRLRPRPKDRSLFALRSPLLVDGTFKDPSFRPDLARVGLRGAIALALGSITPPAALLATLELGPGEDSSCGGRYAK